MATTKAIDRQTTTPFHLKLFYRASGFHALPDFPVPTPSQPSPPLPSHIQIYTWQSCDLRELSHCLTTALPDLIPSPAVGTRLSFRLVFPDTRPGGRDETRGRYMSKDIGSVVIAPEPDDRNGESTAALTFGGDDLHKTLEDSRFIVGDFVDCAIFPPLADGSVAPPQAPGRGRGYGGENGYNGPRGGSYGGFRGGHTGSGRGDLGSSVPFGEWRRGERLPEPSHGGGGRGYGRGRGRGF